MNYSHRAQPLDNQGYLCLPASSLTIGATGVVGATGVASMNSIKHDDG